MGVLLEGQAGLWTIFGVKSLFNHLLLNTELLPGEGNVKAWSTDSFGFYTLKIITMSAAGMKKEHPPLDSLLGLALGFCFPSKLTFYLKTCYCRSSLLGICSVFPPWHTKMWLLGFYYKSQVC